VALVLAAQWLSATTGGELLERVRQLHPHAKRGLLVPWCLGRSADRRSDPPLDGAGTDRLLRAPACGLRG
jgi:hypothetical protein